MSNKTELESLHNQQVECARLNSTADVCPVGKTRYVAVNNFIMKRLDNGKLVFHNPMESSYAKPSLVVRGGTLTACDKNTLPTALFDTT